MNRVKLYSVVSIDGYSNTPDGGMDWIAEANIPVNLEYGIRSFYEGVGTIVMTLNHYLSLACCDLLNPHMEKQCVIVRGDKDLGIPSSHKVKYITDAAEGYPEVIKHVGKLKNGAGGDIWIVGDHKLVKAMFMAEVIDEVIITMIPVPLGRGIRLFPSNFNDRNWKPTRVYTKDGVTQIHYRILEPGAHFVTS